MAIKITPWTSPDWINRFVRFFVPSAIYTYAGMYWDGGIDGLVSFFY